MTLRKYKIAGVGLVVSGTVLQGSVKAGDTVHFSPGNLTGKVGSIETYHKSLDQAFPGHIIGIGIRGVRDRDVIQTGTLVHASQSNEYKPCKFIRAAVFVQGNSCRQIRRGMASTIFCGTGKSPVSVGSILWKR